MKLRSLQAEEKAAVQMAPLIDCVFILLIFFLVTSMLQKPHKELAVETPHSGVADQDSGEPQPLLIAIRADLPGGLAQEQQTMRRLARDKRPEEKQRFEAVIVIGDEVLNKELLTRRLRQVAQETPNRRIRLDVHGHLEWRHVVPVIDLCRFHGLTRVDVRTP